MSSFNSKVSGKPPSHLGVGVAVVLVPYQPLQQSYRVGMGHGPGLARLLPIDDGVPEEFLNSYVEESRCRRGKPGRSTTRATRGSLGSHF